MAEIKATIYTPRARHHLIIGLVSLWFAASSVLCIHSDNRIAMTIGDRYPALWEQVPLWISMILQPWIILSLIIESMTGTYFFSTSLVGPILVSGLSGALMYLIARWAVGRFRVAGWLFIGVLAVLAAFDTHYFVPDMRSLPPVDSHSGP